MIGWVVCLPFFFCEDKQGVEVGKERSKRQSFLKVQYVSKRLVGMGFFFRFWLCLLVFSSGTSLMFLGDSQRMAIFVKMALDPKAEKQSKPLALSSIESLS